MAKQCKQRQISDKRAASKRSRIDQFGGPNLDRGGRGRGGGGMMLQEDMEYGRQWEGPQGCNPYGGWDEGWGGDQWGGGGWDESYPGDYSAGYYGEESGYYGGSEGYYHGGGEGYYSAAESGYHGDRYGWGQQGSWSAPVSNFFSSPQLSSGSLYSNFPAYEYMTQLHSTHLQQLLLQLLFPQGMTDEERRALEIVEKFNARNNAPPMRGGYGGPSMRGGPPPPRRGYGPPGRGYPPMRGGPPPSYRGGPSRGYPPMRGSGPPRGGMRPGRGSFLNHSSK